MAFQIKSDKKDSETKSIRFPKKLIEEIEKTIQGREVTFTGFVIQACEYALEDMVEDETKGQDEKKRVLDFSSTLMYNLLRK